MEVFTEEWARACGDQINARERYRDVAATWEWPVVLVMTADETHGLSGDRAFVLDLFRGACRGTRPATAGDRGEAPYVMEAGPAAWREILAGRLDPVSALMQGKLRLARGSLFVLARYTEAAKEMVAAAAQVPGTFPGETS
jgi:putative sterol carrier protein